MSRSYRHGKHNLEERPWWQRPWNKEWWTARPFSTHNAFSRHGWNWWFKRATHKRERLEAKKEIERRLREDI